MVGTIICEIGTIICNIGTINMRFYLLELRYPYGYCRINLTSIQHSKFCGQLEDVDDIKAHLSK
jgi:hypothetical protein